MFGFKFDKRGAVLFFLCVTVSLLINGVFYLIVGEIMNELGGFVVHAIVIYLFSMFYHKKKKIVFSGEELKNIAYSYQFFIIGIILLVVFANPFFITYLFFIALPLFVVFYYFFIYFILWMYNKINKLG